MNPLVVATKFAKPKTLAAKFGAKSCGFCADVMVEAPLKARESVIRVMQMYGLLSTKQNPISIIPGMM